VSEFSESYHFRHPQPGDDEALRTALDASSLTGVLLPPSGGWRVFVPFESSPSDADQTGARLSLVVGAPVLEYDFAEDYVWAFCVWDNGDPMTAYALDLRRKKPKVSGEIEPGMLQKLLPADTPVSVLMDLLLQPVLTRDAAEALREQFVAHMSLTHFEYVGPHTIADVLEEFRDQEGCIVLGTPPAVKESPSFPTLIRSSVPFALTTNAWSAREALAQLTPHATAWSADVVLLSLGPSPFDGTFDERISMGAWINSNGRTTSTGGWAALFHSPGKNQFISVSLVVPISTIVIIAECYRSELSVAVTGPWIDSPEVIAITEPLYEARRGPNTPPLFDRTMRLTSTAEGTQWSVLYQCFENGASEHLEFTLDAVDGRVRRP
jgi:hypothetical protein